MPNLQPKSKFKPVRMLKPNTMNQIKLSIVLVNDMTIKIEANSEMTVAALKRSIALLSDCLNENLMELRCKGKHM